MPRTRAEQRHHAQRIIQKRMHILLDIWHISGTYYAARLHALSKFNLVCTCRHCSATRQKYRDKPRARLFI